MPGRRCRGCRPGSCPRPRAHGRYRGKAAVRRAVSRSRAPRVRAFVQLTCREQYRRAGKECHDELRAILLAESKRLRPMCFETDEQFRNGRPATDTSTLRFATILAA